MPRTPAVPPLKKAAPAPAQASSSGVPSGHPPTAILQRNQQRQLITRWRRLQAEHSRCSARRVTALQSSSAATRTNDSVGIQRLAGAKSVSVIAPDTLSDDKHAASQQATRLGYLSRRATVRPSRHDFLAPAKPAGRCCRNNKPFVLHDDRQINPPGFHRPTIAPKMTRGIIGATSSVGLPRRLASHDSVA